ncbi:MAG: hypothetical protein AAF490_25740 [Chloroflexota bacterium]
MSQDPMDQNFGAPEKPAKQGMSQTTKIVLGVVAVLLVLCCGITIVGGFIFQRTVTSAAEGFDDPAVAQETAAEIVDYTLPAGFQEEGTMSIIGIDMVFISNNSADSLIMLMSFPQLFAGNEEQMQQQMEDSINENFGDENINFSYVESRDVVINDQNVTVNIFEGTNENGVNFRQATAIFETDSGKPAMFMVMSPNSQWDSSDLDGFIDSLN